LADGPDTDPVEFRVLGDPDGGPALDLDHERFAYAGKFVLTDVGKAVARDGGAVVAAASFDRDRTDESVVRIRYVTVRRDRQGEAIGAELLAFLASHLLNDREDVDAVLIAVNNAFAYEAAYKAGFCYTGRETGLYELVLARPGDRSAGAYRDGVARLRERDGLDEVEAAFLAERAGGSPPALVGPFRDA
jgi:GNAT superfamily N-acetyltransferase